jgi:hypothetical protein
MNHDRDDTSELLDTIQRQAKELTDLRAALEAERQARYAEYQTAHADRTEEAGLWFASFIFAGVWLEVLPSFSQVLQSASDALYNSGHHLQAGFLYLVGYAGLMVATYVVLKVAVATYRALRNRWAGRGNEDATN